MKTVGIMQPYLFPYLGYFQLISHCDVFVWLDDAQYITRGWMNRNRILLGGKAHDFVFGVRKGDQKLPINERWYTEQFPREAEDFLKTLQLGYRRAPHYGSVRELLRRLLSAPERNVAAFNCTSLETLCACMGIAPAFTRSSLLPETASLRGEERIIAIVKSLEGDRYLNAIGGMSLYSSDRFTRSGLMLNFLRSGEGTYAQFGAPFVGRLSIIDALMFAQPGELLRLLGDCDFVGQREDAIHAA
ncbi:MAG TPA: WbqC family protein [Bacteroidota bacterium]|nr:WbqC family protein [Bacteroidota bacterium]